MATYTIKAEPYDFEFDPKTTALAMIDFQRDFVYPGGFGEALGNDTSLLMKAVPPAEKVLQAVRDKGVFVFHTREGTGLTYPTWPRRRRNAAISRPASATRARWAASSCAASTDTTSWTS